MASIPGIGRAPSAPSSGPELEWLVALLASVFEPYCGVGAASNAELAQQLGFPARRALRKERAVQRAMAQLAGPARAIGVGSDGEPVWPAGWVGSVSHAEPYSVAVVAAAKDASSIGVDLEVERVVSEAFAKRVCSASELEGLRSFSADAEQLSAVLFSVKEAVFKLQFPLDREPWSFRRTEVRLEPHCFVAAIRDAQPPFDGRAEIRGAWRRERGVILAGASLAPGARGAP